MSRIDACEWLEESGFHSSSCEFTCGRERLLGCSHIHLHTEGGSTGFFGGTGAEWGPAGFAFALEVCVRGGLQLGHGARVAPFVWPSQAFVLDGASFVFPLMHIEGRAKQMKACAVLPHWAIFDPLVGTVAVLLVSVLKLSECGPYGGISTMKSILGQ
uniref:Uncharacterized protein n=1 Tax=Knipowitschia caucasica TaxID=637954 RepID=A0AAV2JXF7_KNICA